MASKDLLPYRNPLNELNQRSVNHLLLPYPFSTTRTPPSNQPYFLSIMPLPFLMHSEGTKQRTKHTSIK